MTIAPAQFGLDVDNGAIRQKVFIVLPAIEAPAEWVDDEEPQNRYHRCRARANIDVANGDTLEIEYGLDESFPQYFTDTEDGPQNDVWTTPWATAQETSQYIDHHHAVPNSTPAGQSHRFLVASVKLHEVATGTPVANAIQIGWPHDTAATASEPDVELTARTNGAAHRADAYHSGSAWLIARGLLGTARRLIYDSNYRITSVMQDQR